VLQPCSKAVIHHLQRILGTDWPGVPGVARNVRGVAALGLPDDVLAGVLSGHAARVYLRSWAATVRYGAGVAG
jgi:hypothetical protein